MWLFSGHMDKPGKHPVLNQKHSMLNHETFVHECGAEKRT